MQSPSSSKDVAEHHRDIKAIQLSRATVGCSCKPLKLDKLNMAKLREEIIARRPAGEGAEDLSTMKRTELVSCLKDLLLLAQTNGSGSCSLCTANGCDCVRGDIACNARCSCTDCGNPQGRDVFDAVKVQGYRRRILALLADNSRKEDGGLFVCHDAM